LILGAQLGCTKEHSHSPSATFGKGDVKRGQYLTATFGCQECHTVRQADDAHLDPALLFAGGVPFPVQDRGVVYSANVTLSSQYPDNVLEGIIRGRLAFKFQMPTHVYNEMAGDDMLDILAYLKRLRPILRPLPDNMLPPHFVLPSPTMPITAADHEPPTGTLARGAYLARMCLCQDCHSPHDANGNYDQAHLFGGGGYQVRLANGRVLNSPNLTPDLKEGVGAWSDSEIIRAIRTGVARNGRQLDHAMPSLTAFYRLTDQDVEEIVHFLRSLRPVASEESLQTLYPMSEAH
jgi:mono/diheme cytochrome c family protein